MDYKTKSGQALKALEDPKNEPLNWLFGEALREHIRNPCWHFLLEQLTTDRRWGLIWWNSRIHEFRDALVNPEAAPARFALQLRGNPKKPSDLISKIMAAGAELQAVVELGNRGFDHIEVVEASNSQSTPDFLGQRLGKQVRIEVKNLELPRDHINIVAKEEWELRTRQHPKWGRFDVLLSYTSSGLLSDIAITELRKRIGEVRKEDLPLNVLFDGHVSVTIDHLKNASLPKEFLDGLLPEETAGRILFVRPFGVGDFGRNSNIEKRLFLKSLRVIVEDVHPKFFSNAAMSDEVENLAVLRWQTHELLIDREMLDELETDIEELYRKRGIPFELIILHEREGEIPASLVRLYE